MTSWRRLIFSSAGVDINLKFVCGEDTHFYCNNWINKSETQQVVRRSLLCLWISAAFDAKPSSFNRNLHVSNTTTALHLRTVLIFSNRPFGVTAHHSHELFAITIVLQCSSSVSSPRKTPQTAAVRAFVSFRSSYLKSNVRFLKCQSFAIPLQFFRHWRCLYIFLLAIVSYTSSSMDPNTEIMVHGGGAARKMMLMLWLSSPKILIPQKINRYYKPRCCRFLRRSNLICTWL